MKIVYLLGNGFDINLGLKTRYTDFYEYYLKKDSKNNIIEKLKSNIFDNVVNWSDLELALGQYTSSFESVLEFDNVYEDLLNGLCDYLNEESKKYDFSNLKNEVFFTDLCKPEFFLKPGDINEFKEYKNQWGSSERNISIINFNYTNTLEKITDALDLKQYIAVFNGIPFYLKDLIHVHGSTDERTILGVNDITQIGNENFHKENDIIEALIKTESNDKQKHLDDKKCQNLINSADIICIFGCSLGETDKFWWNLIGKNLKRGIKVVIFFRAEEQNPRFQHKILRLERKIRSLFLSMSDLSDEEYEIFGKNVYIKINAEIFQLNNIEHNAA